MKKRIKVRIDDFIDYIETSNHTIVGHFKDDEGVTMSEVLLSNSMFKTYLENMFYNRCFPIILDETRTIENNVKTDFEAKWACFLEENAHNIDRIAESLYAYYNPIHNYNKIQHDVNTKTGNETDNRTLNNGATERNTAETGTIQDSHVHGAQESTTTRATMDTTVYQPQSKINDISYTDTDTHSYNNHNVKDTTKAVVNTDNNTKTYNNVKDDFTSEVKGNIGVMESVTMIESELRLRKTQIGLDLLQRFFDTYSFFV